MIMLVPVPACHSRRRDAISVTTGRESICRRLRIAFTKWVPFPRIAFGDARRERQMGGVVP